MNHSDERMRAIPTNIITGFLGVGKTTAILHLLQQKPVAERWAVLVNEFGEIGVDGSLFQGQYSESSGVFIREVPGGCMCCAAGLPMHIALNQLLARARPDRLLIEPSGLGHPKEVLTVLSAEHYHEVLDIQQNLTLVDARKLRDTRYTEHATFNQQIDVADIIVGNKQDLYQENDKELLQDYVMSRKGTETVIVFANQGLFESSLLHGSSTTAKAFQGVHHHARELPEQKDDSVPECGYVKVENAGEGYQSVGWRFSPDKVFDRPTLYRWLSDIQAERMKAVFITSEGVFGYNFTADTLVEVELDDCLDSRIEIISDQVDSDWEKALMKCIQHG